MNKNAKTFNSLVNRFCKSVCDLQNRATVFTHSWCAVARGVFWEKFNFYNQEVTDAKSIQQTK